MTRPGLRVSAAVFLFFCFVLPVFLGIFKYKYSFGEYLLPTVSFEKEKPSGELKPERSMREVGDFGRQAEWFVRRARLSRPAARNHAAVLDAVRLELRKLWTDFELTPFGSVVSGLALSTNNDLDMYVTLPRTNNTIYNASVLVLQTAEIFKQNDSYTGIHPICNVTPPSVPLLRFIFKPTNQRCDLSFKKYEFGSNTALMKYMFGVDDRALNLMIIIKYWAKINKIKLAYYMTSIVWCKLVVFYLQQVHILPSVYELQRQAKKTMISNWNTAFEESYVFVYPSENSSPLYDIVGGFFVYFSNFNFERDCVSIFAGKPVARMLFESVETVPEEFALYKGNLRNNVSKPLTIDTPICVQRAFLHDDNISRTVYPALLAQIKRNLMTAADLCRTTSDRDFLSALLNVDK